MNLHIGWPQAIFLSLHIIGVAYTLVRKDRTAADYFGSFAGSAVTLGLLYWGGFFG